MLEITIIVADSRRDKGNYSQKYLPFAFKIRKFKAWYTRGFAPSVSSNLNLFFTLSYSQMCCFVVVVCFPVFEVSQASLFPSSFHFQIFQAISGL